MAITTKKAAGPHRYRVIAVERALSVLSALATLPKANASQLALALGENRSMVFRMLSTLSEQGFVTKDEQNCYSLGPRLLYLGQRAQASNALVAASRIAMDQLFRETDEATFLFIRDGLDGLCLATRLPQRQLRIVVDVGSKSTIFRGPIGKVLLAFAPPETVREAMIQHFKTSPASKTRLAKESEELEKLLNKIRRDRYYEAVGDAEKEIYTLNAIVWDGLGKFAAVLMIAVPINRASAERRAFLKANLVAAADTISGLLGYSA